jgi:tRNA-splicing ligase RtcB
MKARQLEKMGYPRGLAKGAKWAASAAVQAGVPEAEARQTLTDLLKDPQRFRDDPHFGDLAVELSRLRTARENVAAAAQRPPREQPAPYKQWGEDLDPQSIQQMQNACRLPIAERGALMPDAHVGYGLPIGGVLATRGAVVPYAVGVDIACRMKLTVLDLPTHALQSQRDRLIGAIETETRFGMGASFDRKGRKAGPVRTADRREHSVMDDDWTVSPITQRNKDKAHAQLGTSGSGNHFVEFGVLTLDAKQAAALDLDTSLGAPVESHDTADTPDAPPRFAFLALLSHSGSRGTGASVCQHYSRLAMDLHPELPRDMQHLAWLDLDTPEGREYWDAMNLMGRYAAANHACIHAAIARHLGVQVLLDVENHHNFAWKETHDGEELIVHRKGATPASPGALGIIPGSMAAPGYLVRGKGNAASLHSAAHGAGRVMSRTKAKQSYRWSHLKQLLKDRGVELLSAGIDENPHVYKDIDAVMAAQQDLVETVARFDPKLVKMAPEGEKAED